MIDIVGSSRTNLRGFTILLCLIGLCIVGCSAPEGPTSGVVRFDDGSPVSSGSIELRRRSDEERFASRIASDGTFQPADENGDVGLPVGKYDVVIVQIVITEDLAIEDHTHGKTVPRRYADYYTSDLNIEVVEGQLEPIEIVIESAETPPSK